MIHNGCQFLVREKVLPSNGRNRRKEMSITRLLCLIITLCVSSNNVWAPRADVVDIGSR